MDPEKERRKREKARQAHIDKLKAEGGWPALSKAILRPCPN